MPTLVLYHEAFGELLSRTLVDEAISLILLVGSRDEALLVSDRGIEADEVGALRVHVDVLKANEEEGQFIHDLEVQLFHLGL